MADRFEKLDPPDSDDLEEEEEEVEEDEDDDDPRTRGLGAAPSVSVPASVKAQRREKPEAAPGKGSSHRGQQVRKRGRVPEGVTRPSQADLLWLDILQRKEIVSRGIEADHFAIKVARLDGGQEIYLTSIDGSRCSGDGSEGSAGEALMRILTDEIHWHSSKGMAATYQLTFTFKRGGTIYDKGKIRLPSLEEIAQMRNAASGLGRPPQQGGYPQQPPPHGPQGYAPPYAQPPYGYPFYYPPHPGFGAPPAPSTGDEVTDLREQVRSLSEMVRDMWRFGPQGQQGQYGQPQGFGQPPPPQGLPLSALHEFERVLTPFGLTIAPRGQPQQITAPAAASGFQQGLGQLKELAVGVSALKEVADALNNVFNTNAAAVVEEPKPEPDFEMVEVPGAKWPNGEPIRYARDDKGINWFGTGLGNGYAMDKFGSVLAGIGNTIAKQISAGQGVGVGALADDDDEKEEQSQPQPQPQPQPPIVTSAPENPQLPRMNGYQRTRGEDFSL